MKELKLTMPLLIAVCLGLLLYTICTLSVGFTIGTLTNSKKLNIEHWHATDDFVPKDIK